MTRAVLRSMLSSGERLFDGWFARERDGSALWILLVLFVLIWTTFHTVVFSSITLQADMTESYAWGLQPSWGNLKHPPLAGLMVGAWFAVFPVTDWSFNLMAMMNVAIAFLFIDLIARRYLTGDKRLLVLLLLLLTPFYQFHAQQFSTNQALLSTWPLATYCFLRAFESRALGWSVAVGAAAALAMLAKYYSIFLVLGFIVAALAHPARREYLRSWSPWLSAVTGIVVLVPHAIWLVDNNFPPFNYASIRTGHTAIWDRLRSAIEYLFGGVGYVALPALVTVAITRPWRAGLADMFWPDDPRRRMLVVLLAATLLSPIVIEVLVELSLTSLWAMQAWFLLPIVMLSPPSITVTRTASIRVAASVLLFAILMLLVAPGIAWNNHLKRYDDGRPYLRDVSRQVTQLWQEATGKPLRYVDGPPNISFAVAFYSPVHPLPALDHAFPSGMSNSSKEFAREGWAMICRTVDQRCVADLDGHIRAHTGSKRVDIVSRPSFFGVPREPESYVVGLFPPAAKS